MAEQDKPFRNSKTYMGCYAALLGDAPAPTTKTPRKPRVPHSKWPTEYQEQTTLVKWCKLAGLKVYAIPNDGNRSVGGHMRAVALGLWRGASDLFLAHMSKGYGGYHIEMKSRGKKPRPEQYHFMETMRKQGYKAEWFDDWTLAKASIEEYLNGN